MHERAPQNSPPTHPSSALEHASLAMRHALELARRVAASDATVLIGGETGSGKERVARFIHDTSSRREGPFLAINCGSIAETLLESELFGHVRGAFTGATQERIGLLEEANGGTLLLDEVGELSPASQVRLLRVLQEREVRRVGENRARPVDLRVLAATNRDLSALTAAGVFRLDLLYRLKVVEVRVPPLRERQADVEPLAQHFLARAAIRAGRAIPELTPAAVAQLLRHDWPGNVRELENAMEHAAALCDRGEVGVEDLPDEVRRAPQLGAGPGLTLASVERRHILDVLAANDGNRGITARQLEIGSATLYRKLKEYGRAR